MSRKSCPLAPFERRAILRRAFLDSLPVLMGYTTMGFVAGVLLATKGNLAIAPLWAFLTSCSMSGTLNYAIVQPVANRVALWSFVLLVAGINFRYVFYGFTVIARWKKVPFFKKMFLIHMLTDENYALEVASRYKDENAFVAYCLRLSVFNFFYWVGGVTFGAIVVAILKGALDPEMLKRWTNGMEFAMTALFLVIFTDQMKSIFAHHLKGLFSHAHK